MFLILLITQAVISQMETPKTVSSWERIVAAIFSGNTRQSPRRGQRIKTTVRVEQPGKTALFIELGRATRRQRRLLAPCRQVNGIRRRYLCYASLIRPRTS